MPRISQMHVATVARNRPSNRHACAVRSSLLPLRSSAMNSTLFSPDRLLAYLVHFLNLTSPISTQQTSENAGSNTRAALEQPQWVFARRSHAIIPLSDAQLSTISSYSNKDRFLQLVNPILIPRVSGTPGNLKVQQHIINTLTSLGYTVELDRFEDQPPRPHARRTFTNIIATLKPTAPRRLVIACHFDSKFDSLGQFIGATDSAVPCAMMLDLATVLKGRISNPDVTLQFLFFDGEEAFGEWSATDSLYGSRNLAKKLHTTRNRFAPNQSNLNELHSMDLFVLLDLIGTKETSFVNFNSDTASFYNRFAANEDRLAGLRLIARNGRSRPYFGRGAMPMGSFVDDDHRPFQERGVPIVHLISTPFPSVWHTLADNWSNIDWGTVDDLNKVLRAFVCEYLSCQI